MPALVWEKDGHLRYCSGRYLIAHHGPRSGFSVILIHEVQTGPWCSYDSIGNGFRLLAEAKAAAQAHADAA